jgi:hypothetical protein
MSIMLNKNQGIRVSGGPCAGIGCGRALFVCGIVLLLSTLGLFSVADSPGDTASSRPRSSCTDTAAEVIVDLDVLEDRLKETKAVGVFTKLKLKGEITKLFNKVEAYHEGRSNLTIVQLREQFDLLYMKVVSLLQEKDQELHHQLCNSWDLIWATLEDPVQFDQLSALEQGADHVYF